MPATRQDVPTCLVMSGCAALSRSDKVSQQPAENFKLLHLDQGPLHEGDPLLKILLKKLLLLLLLSPPNRTENGIPIATTDTVSEHPNRTAARERSSTHQTHERPERGQPFLSLSVLHHGPLVCVYYIMANRAKSMNIPLPPSFGPLNQANTQHGPGH